jgi:hypothetical protein
MTAAGPMNIPAPIDHVGDPKLGDGQFTFVLSIRDGQLVSGLERDNRSSSPDHVESGVRSHSGGSDVAEIPGRPILVPSVATPQGVADASPDPHEPWTGTVKSGRCGGKEATASIPEASLIALTKAQLADDFDEISRISEEAGLQMMVLRKAGQVVSYIIENHNGQCVAMRGRRIKN